MSLDLISGSAKVLVPLLWMSDGSVGSLSRLATSVHALVLRSLRSESSNIGFVELALACLS